MNSFFSFSSSKNQLKSKNYHYLSKIKLTQDQRKSLFEYATDPQYEKLFKKYKTHSGLYDGNEILVQDESFVNHPIVIELLSKCKLKCYPLLIRHQPRVEIPKHIDDKNKRDSIVIFPVYPEIGYAPTLFWDDFESLDPIEIVTYENLQTCLIDTQKIHSVKNLTPNIRINLQLCFEENFEYVKKFEIESGLFHD